MKTPPAVSRAADRQLRALLRTPKSLSGLHAAVRDVGVGYKFVSAWVRQRVKEGAVGLVQGPRGMLYQVAAEAHVIVLASSKYPAWLEPRPHLPVADRRTVYIGALDVSSPAYEKSLREELEECD